MQMFSIRVILFFLLSIAMQVQAEDCAQLLLRGDNFYIRLETEEALRCYRQAYELSPNQSAILIRLVRAYGDLGWLHLRRDTSSESCYLHAVAFAESLLQLEPTKADAHFWFAMAKGSLIPFRGTSEKISIGKEVRIHAERAIELDSTYSYAYIILAIFERERAKLSWFERTIARIVFGEDVNGSLLLSEEYLSKALKCDRNSSYAYYELSRTYDAMGRKGDAVESLKRVLAMPVNSQREERQRQHAEKSLAHLQSVE